VIRRLGTSKVGGQNYFTWEFGALDLSRDETQEGGSKEEGTGWERVCVSVQQFSSFPEKKERTKTGTNGRRRKRRKKGDSWEKTRMGLKKRNTLTARENGGLTQWGMGL